MSSEFSNVGSASTLIAAALETAGQYIQSYFLDVICSSGGMHVGALLWLCSFLVAFFMYALGGQYYFWRYFLIGPGLFFFTVYNRVESDGTKWSFGSKDYDFSIIDTLFGNDILKFKDEDNPPKVSWLFARWDTFTSGVIENLMDLLPATAKQGNLKLLRQAQRYSALFNMSVDNNNLSALLSQLIYHRQCTDYISLALATYQEPLLYDITTTPDPSATNSDLNQNGVRYQGFRHLRAAGRNAVLSFHDQATKDMWNYLFARATKHFFRSANMDSLEDATEGAGEAITQIASLFNIITSAMNFLNGCNGNTNITGGIGEQLNGMIEEVQRIVEIVYGVAAALNLVRVHLTCGQLWDIGVDLTTDYASQKIETLIYKTLTYEEDPELNTTAEEDKDLSFKLLATKFDYQGCDFSESRDSACFKAAAENMYRNVALRILVYYMTTINPYQVGGSTSSISIGGSPYQGYAGVSEDIQYQSIADLHQTKGQLIGLVWGLPQIQAMALFFLSVAFPFFAFTFLIPGRHWSIGTWMSLWFWVKLWDVGFAMVMIVDQILYYLLPKQPFITDAMFYHPGEAIHAMFEHEPQVPISFYYSILGMLLLAVPVVTGFIVKRGGAQFAGFIKGGVSRFSSDVSGNYNVSETQVKSERAVQLNERSRKVLAHADDPMKEKNAAVSSITSRVGFIVSPSSSKFVYDRPDSYRLSTENKSSGPPISEESNVNVQQQAPQEGVEPEREGVSRPQGGGSPEVAQETNTARKGEPSVSQGNASSQNAEDQGNKNQWQQTAKEKTNSNQKSGSSVSPGQKAGPTKYKK